MCSGRPRWTPTSPTSLPGPLDYEDDEDADDEAKPSKKKKPWRYRWPDDVRDEVLARLLALNQERVREETLSGAAAEPGTAKTARPGKKGAKGGSGSLFGG